MALTLRGMKGRQVISDFLSLLPSQGSDIRTGVAAYHLKQKDEVRGPDVEVCGHKTSNRQFSNDQMTRRSDNSATQ
jgi:hypothetical protein